MNVIKPAQLQSGATVGLITPASPVADKEKIRKSIDYLVEQGYKVKTGQNVGEVSGYLAGSDEQRVNDIHALFSDPEVKAIFCLRGGYGSGRMLDRVDYSLIRNNPKIFIGYSDITALHSAFFSKCGLVTFSGPMPAVDFQSESPSFTTTEFWKLVQTRDYWKEFRLPESANLTFLTEGTAEGTLLGGNLTLINSLLGTAYLPDLRGSILFIEDIGEPPYRIDRMLNQLKLANVLSKLQGVILGDFSECIEPEPEKPTLSLQEVFANYFGDLSVPVLAGFPHGHIKLFSTLPLGIKVRISSLEKPITLLENPFAD